MCEDDGRKAGELLDGGPPSAALQPLTHGSDRPPKAPVIWGLLIEREREGRTRGGNEGGEERRRDWKAEREGAKREGG